MGREGNRLTGPITQLYLELKDLQRSWQFRGLEDVGVDRALADVEMLMLGQHETLLRQLDEAAADLVLESPSR